MRYLVISKKSRYFKKISALATLSISPMLYAADLDTIVVSASGFEQQVKEAPATISVITSESIKNEPYRDITDVLSEIPGVDVIGNGASTDISIRGMDPRYTLMLVDGKRVNVRETGTNGYDAGIQQGWLPPLSAIERIEVIRGPMSSLYGSDAMGGVINIITKKGSDHWIGNIRIEAIVPQYSKAKSLFNSNFSLSGPLADEKLNVLLYGQYFDRAEDKYAGGHSAKRLKSLNGRFSYGITDGQTLELDIGRTWQNTEAKVNGSRPTNSKNNFYRHDQRSNIALSHQGIFDLFVTNTVLSFEENMNSVRDMSIKNTDLNTQIILPLESHTVTFGGQYLYQDLYDSNNQINKAKTKIERWRYSLFVEDEWHLLDNFALTGGGRFNKDENYGVNWNPRLYAVWDIDSNYTLKGGYSTGYTAPELRYVVSDWGQVTGQGTGVILGNPNLKPETSNNYELTLSYLNDYGLDVATTLFYTKFKNKIQTYDECNNNGCIYEGSSFKFIQGRENIDRAEVKGLELTMKTPITDKYLLTANYAYILSKQLSGTNQGLPLNNTPKHKVNLKINWFYSNKFDYWAKASYIGKEIETSSKGSLGLGHKYPSHTTFDLGINYKISAGTMIYGGIYNLLNRKIIDEDYGKTLEGRRYWLGLDIQF